LFDCPGCSIHDSDPNIEVLYATKDGVGSRVTGVKGEYRYHMDYMYELDGIDLESLDRAVGRLFLEAINRGLRVFGSERAARLVLSGLPYDVGYSRSLTQSDLSGIPDGMGLAICYPEYLGYMSLDGNSGEPATRWGAYLRDYRRTMVLFKV
jgi:hypothetical protein